MLHGILGISMRLVLNVSKAFVKPGAHSLTAKLNLLDLAECRENLLQMILVDIPGEPANVDLGWLGGGGSLPGWLG